MAMDNIVEKVLERGFDKLLGEDNEADGKDN